MKRVVVLFSLCLLLCSCGKNENKENDSSLQENDGTITCVKMNDLVTNEDAILIDVRTQSEYNEGHLDGAIHLDYETIDKNIGKKVARKDTKIVVYCHSGRRSSAAKKTLEDLGYTNVYDMGSMEKCSQ